MSEALSGSVFSALASSRLERMNHDAQTGAVKFGFNVLDNPVSKTSTQTFANRFLMLLETRLHRGSKNEVQNLMHFDPCIIDQLVAFVATLGLMPRSSGQLVQHEARLPGRHTHRGDQHWLVGARLVSIFLLLVIALFFNPVAGMAMPADAQDPSNLESVRAGQVVADRVCSRCHAVGLQGKSRNPKSPPFRTIVARHPDKDLPGVFFLDGTVLSHPGMPQFEFQITQVDGLIAYIRSLAQKRP